MTIGAPDDAAEDKTVNSFDFGTITHEEPGTYKYVITEVDAERATPLTGQTVDGIHYDAEPIKVKVTVSDDLRGGLMHSVAFEGDSVFSNFYEMNLDYSAEGGLTSSRTSLVRASMGASSSSP